MYTYLRFLRSHHVIVIVLAKTIATRAVANVWQFGQLLPTISDSVVNANQLPTSAVILRDEYNLKHLFRSQSPLREARMDI